MWIHPAWCYWDVYLKECCILKETASNVKRIRNNFVKLRSGIGTLGSRYYKIPSLSHPNQKWRMATAENSIFWRPKVLLIWKKIGCPAITTFFHLFNTNQILNTFKGTMFKDCSIYIILFMPLRLPVMLVHYIIFWSGVIHRRRCLLKLKQPGQGAITLEFTFF